MHEPSHYQQAIYEFIENDTGNAIIEGVAGCGKTTTILEGLRYCEDLTGVLFCAFNKAIVEELRGKTPFGVEVKTLHSLGYRVLRDNLDAHVELTNHKIQELTKTALDADVRSRRLNLRPYYLRRMVMQLVNLCRSCVVRPTEEALADLVDHYGVDLDGTPPDLLQEWINSILNKSNQLALEKGKIDFDDMIYLPALHLDDWRFPHTYDAVFVDEAQDLSSAQRSILERLLGPFGRLVAVGDEAQAIYGFRGADVNSMALIRDHFVCDKLPLSVCYRCPTRHVHLAKSLVPRIEAAPGAEDGVLENIGTGRFERLVAPGDLVIARRNFPLVDSALRLIAGGKKAVVRGRDFATGLRSMVERTQHDNLDQALGKIQHTTEVECDRLKREQKEDQADALRDRYLCLRTLSQGLLKTDQLLQRIDKIFDDSCQGTIFSSVHRAKGLEADNVFILEPERMPMRWQGQRDWQWRQELNLQYVALTRAKKALRFVR